MLGNRARLWNGHGVTRLGLEVQNRLKKRYKETGAALYHLKLLFVP